MLTGLICGCGNLMIGPGVQDFQKDLHNGYTLCRSSVNYIVLDKTGDQPETVLPPKLVALGMNDEFIVGKQFQLISEKSSGSEKRVDETKPLFWIIEIKTQKRYGPMDEDGFNKTKKSLGVPGELKLESVETYAP